MNARSMRLDDLETTVRQLRTALATAAAALPVAEEEATGAHEVWLAQRGLVQSLRQEIVTLEGRHAAHTGPRYTTNLRGQTVEQPRVSCTCAAEIGRARAELDGEQALLEHRAAESNQANRRRGQIRQRVRNLTQDIAQAEEEIAVRATLPERQRQRPRPYPSPVRHLIPTGHELVTVA